MRVDLFDYELPEELIAQEPIEPRDAARLLVLDGATGGVEHRVFRDLPEYLQPGDCLVLNDTRVRRARLLGRREPGGGRVEVLLLHPVSRGADGQVWDALVRPGRKLLPGTRFVVGVDGVPAIRGEVLERTPAGGRLVRLEGEDLDAALERVGRVPLPPYIRRDLRDDERYQTVYAREPGSAAAPTAGLHFAPQLLQRIRDLGVRVASLTLHIGLGTFRPVRTEHVEQHRLHAEPFRVPSEVAEAVAAARREGRRVFACGTTVCRALEAAAGPDGTVRPGEGWTDLFIYPGYRFKVVDALITNFHLPRSTLLMLVCAFAGRERVLAAYREAVRLRYRFYSFGDAMLVFRAPEAGGVPG